MNNKLPLIKEKSFLYENKDETKSKLMNTMTQEIMTNFKKKIHQLESDNKKLTDDLLALTRNFEALSLKHQEDLNLIKRLQSELNKYQIMSNETSQLNIKNDMIKSLQIHNEELINDIKKMEIRYKNEIKKLSDENKTIRKQFEELKMNMSINSNKENSDIIMLKKEREENERKINELNEEVKRIKGELIKEKSMNKDLINMNDMLVKEKERLSKENKMMYQTIEQTREKLNIEMKKESELQRQLKMKPKGDIELEHKYKDAIDEVNKLSNLIDTLKQENSFNELNCKTLMDELSQIKNRKFTVHIDKQKPITIKRQQPKEKPKIIYKIVNQNTFSYIINTKTIVYEIRNEEVFSLYPIIHVSFSPNKVISNEISFTYPPGISQVSLKIISMKSSIQSQLTKELNLLTLYYEDKFGNTISSKISKMEHTISKLEHLFNNVIPSMINDYQTMKRESNYMKQKSLLDIKKLTDTYEAKLTKKRNKKYSLKNEIKDLNDKIAYLNQTKVDLTEINKLFNQISEIVSRLKLTIDTLQNSINCKNCNATNKKMIILDCGHSLCKDCVSNPKLQSCIECQYNFKSSIKPNYIENYSLNNISSRYGYVRQQVEGDLDLVLSTIQSYLNK